MQNVSNRTEVLTFSTKSTTFSTYGLKTATSRRHHQDTFGTEFGKHGRRRVFFFSPLSLLFWFEKRSITQHCNMMTSFVQCATKIVFRMFYPFCLLSGLVPFKILWINCNQMLHLRNIVSHNMNNLSLLKLFNGHDARGASMETSAIYNNCHHWNGF